jgi:hypothetical protein
LPRWARSSSPIFARTSRRDGVIVVDVSLDLLAVAEAIARDDKAQVGAWISKRLLEKPSLEMIERWSKAPAPILIAVVVQPYVLVREEPRRADVPQA